MKRSAAPLPYTSRTLVVESTVPFSQLISAWLQLSGFSFDELVRRSRRYERAYLAWETVRKVRNPWFSHGTGFEGYYVGRYDSPEAVLNELLRLGQSMLDSNERLYHFNRKFRSTLIRTLHGDIENSEAVADWAGQFGAALGRLRCNLFNNSAAGSFQVETYRMTSSLPSIYYQWEQQRIVQEYLLSSSPYGSPQGWGVDPDMLKPSDAEAGLVISSIGEFGHPLLRAYLDETLKP